SRASKDPRWLFGSQMNCADSCFLADPTGPAIVSGREGSEQLTVTTCGELNRLSGRVARGLVVRGFAPGDAVALYMPMTPECVAAYLGVVRAGLRVVSIADSFPPTEIRQRVEIGKARAVVTVDAFLRAGKRMPLYQKLIDANAPQTFVIPGMPGVEEPLALRRGDLSWDELLDEDDSFESVVCEPEAVTNVLFSSGTTSTPKAIPWSHVTPLKCAMDGHFHQDIRPGDVVCWPTNIGWMMGPWLIYATLMNRGTIALFDGAPHTAAFLAFVARAAVTVLGVVPSLVAAWRRLPGADTRGVAGVHTFSSTGEPANREDMLWLMRRTGYRAPVIEYCGGTEIGGGYITGTVVQPAAPAMFTTPTLGTRILVLGEDDHRPVGEGQAGEVFLVPPALGSSQVLLNKDHAEVYFRGCPVGPAGELLRRHGDKLQRLHQGYYKVQGRTDDTMNLGGIKVGAVELESAVNTHPAVADSAAVAVQPDGESTERLVVYVTLTADVGKASLSKQELLRELQQRIARQLNPLFKIHDVVVKKELPRTASNKLLRRELRADYPRNQKA
ncbi:MAG: AMP-binding protein, partial [Planctomycetota bacterium]